VPRISLFFEWAGREREKEREREEERKRGREVGSEQGTYEHGIGVDVNGGG